MKNNFSWKQTPAVRKPKALIHMWRNPACPWESMPTFYDQQEIIPNSLSALYFKSKIWVHCTPPPAPFTQAGALLPAPSTLEEVMGPSHHCAYAFTVTWMYSIFTHPWKDMWTKEMSASFQRLQTRSLILKCFIMPGCALTIHRGSNTGLSICKLHFFRWNFSSWNQILLWNSFQRAFCETDAYSISSETIQHPLHDTVKLRHFPHFTMDVWF